MLQIKENDIFRTARKTDSGTALEEGWKVVRTEKDNTVVLEKDGKRISLGAAVLETLNFPGSDKLVAYLKKLNAEKQLAAFAEGNVSAVRSFLLDEVRAMDPQFKGVMTCNDLVEKMGWRTSEIEAKLRVLENERKRAEREYNNFRAKTNFEQDRKDSLLTRLRNFEDQSSALSHLKDKSCTEWIEAKELLELVDSTIAAKH